MSQMSVGSGRQNECLAVEVVRLADGTVRCREAVKVLQRRLNCCQSACRGLTFRRVSQEYTALHAASNGLTASRSSS